MKYTTILFDWDGCLAKTLTIWLEGYRQTFSEFGIQIEDKEITRNIFGDWKGPMKYGVTDIDNYNQKLLARVNSGCPTVGLYDQVYDTLKQLRQAGRKFALLTSSMRQLITPAITHNRVDNLFDLILTAEDVTNHKPDPEVIFKAIEKLGSERETTVIVGDSKSDLEAATRASIDSVLFFPSQNELFYDLERLKEYQPTYVINHFNELLSVVE